MTEQTTKETTGEVTEQTTKEVAEESTEQTVNQTGKELAEELGYPKAPDGYNWANYGRKLVLRRNPGKGPSAGDAALPQLKYDPSSGKFIDVETGKPYMLEMKTGGNNPGDRVLDDDDFRVLAENVAAVSKSIDDLKIDQDGIAAVKEHLSRDFFTSQNGGATFANNDVMIKRLEDIAAGRIEATETDLLFFGHEFGEKQIMDRLLAEGMDAQEAFDIAHATICKEYGITATIERSNPFYTPEADEAFMKQMGY